MKAERRNAPAEGAYAALLTPLRDDVTEPDAAALLDYVDNVVRAGVAGIVLFTTIGEFIHFGLAERMQALRMAIRRSRVPVLVNISHSTLDGAVALAEDAIDSGAAGLLLLPPYFYSYGQHDIQEFFLCFRQEITSDVPLYLYNLPFCTNEISPAVARELLTTGRFAGIYDASDDWTYFESIVDLNGAQKPRVLTGDDKLYLRARRLGAAGCISGWAGVIPELIVAIERALRNGDDNRADLLGQYLHDLIEAAAKLPPQAGLKAMAAARGWKFDTHPVPLSEVSRAELERFRGWLRDWLPGVLRECARV
jgi:4-hydroxy-tetrahydrodipicolinate synthase